MNKKQQIEWLEERVRALTLRTKLLENERNELHRAVTDMRQAAAVGADVYVGRADMKRLPSPEISAGKAPEDMNDSAVAALHKAGEFLAAAQKEAEDTRALALLEAERIKARARSEAEELEKKATLSAEAMLKEALMESDSLTRTAKGREEEERRERQARAREVMNRLSDYNEKLTGDISRQSAALMEAMRGAVEKTLISEAGAEECRDIFAECLAVALKRPRGGEMEAARDLSSTGAGAVSFASVAEFEAMGSYGFRNNVLITKVTLPEGLREIPDSFFFGCANLTEVLLPESIEDIGDYAFFGCGRLAGIRLPEGLERIGAYAFSGCGSIKEIHMPDSLKTIGPAAFRGCTGLKRVEFGADSRAEDIAHHAFQNCRRLSAFRIPGGIRLLPVSLFFGCESLEEMDIPATVERMELSVFHDCDDLRRVRFASPDLVLSPGSMDGLERAELTLCGEPFPWREAEEETTLGVLSGLAGSGEPDGAGEVRDESELSAALTE